MLLMFVYIFICFAQSTFDRNSEILGEGYTCQLLENFMWGGGVRGAARNFLNKAPKILQFPEGRF